MMFLERIFTSPVMPAIGLAMIHLFWQGALIGLLLALTLRMLRDHAPQLRYTASLIAMVGMLAAPLVTTFMILQDQAVTRGPIFVGLPVATSQGALPAWIVPMLPWLASAWIAGALLFQLRLLLDWLHVERLKRVGVRPVARAWQTYVHQLSRHLGIRRRVRMVESTLVRIPAVAGWLSPVILIPAGVMVGLTARELRGIIAHELAHVSRHDYLVNLLQNVFESLLFFHPITWWISRRLRIEREYCCDDIALSLCDGALQYARALSSLEELRAVGLQTALASNGGSLVRRVARMVAQRPVPVTNVGRWLAPTIVLGALVTLVALFGMSCTSEADLSPVVGPLPAYPGAPLAAPVHGEVSKYLVLARVSTTDGPALIDVEVLRERIHAPKAVPWPLLDDLPELWDVEMLNEMGHLSPDALRERIIHRFPELGDVKVEKHVDATGQTKIMIRCREERTL